MRAGTLLALQGIVLSFVASALPAQGDAAGVVAEKLARRLRPGTVLILGEHHRRQESTEIMADVVSAYLKDGGCLAVGLEIANSQQGNLDRALAGTQPLSAVQINPIIDHPGLRVLLARLRALVTDESCLSVHVIDAAPGDPRQRDEAMAAHLNSLSEDLPVLALLGNLHAVKQITWDAEASGSPPAAQRLAAHGRSVYAVLQDWPGQCEQRRPTLRPMSDEIARGALVRIFDPVAARFPHQPSEAADGAITWECRR